MASEHLDDSGLRRVEIPVVDFVNWKPESTPEQRMKVAQEIVSACKSVGFVYILNHGIAPERLAEAFSWSKRFFDLPTEQKRRAPHPHGSSVHRGYSWPGLEKVSQAMSNKDDPELAIDLRQITDYKESYDIGSDQNGEQPNVWIPEDVAPGFREFMIQFYWECFDVGGNILRAIALGLGLEEDHLVKTHSGHNNQLRLLHYPSIPAASVEDEKMARMPAHTDWSSITMLFQDDCGGLEVQYADNPMQFMPATPMKNALVMNVGDLLQRWSNDHLRSTMHRVSLPTLSDRYEGPHRMAKERYSIPYFLAPGPDTLVECLPTCTDEERPPRYFPITQRDYNQHRAMMQYPNKTAQQGSMHGEGY